MFSFSFVLLILLATLRLSAQAPSDPKSGVVEKMPSPQAGEVFVYDPTGLRDPFKIHKSLLKEDKPSFSAQTNKPKVEPEVSDPILRVDLDRVEVLGIMWEVKSPRALLLDKGDPQQRIYTVYRNSKIGRNGGIVKAIEECEVTIHEYIEEAGLRNMIPRKFSICKDKNL